MQANRVAAKRGAVFGNMSSKLSPTAAQGTTLPIVVRFSTLLVTFRHPIIQRGDVRTSRASAKCRATVSSLEASIGQYVVYMREFGSKSQKCRQLF